VQLVPSTLGVVDVGTPDQITLADLRLKIGARLRFAGCYSVGLRYLVLANGIEDKIALLTGNVFLIEEGYELLTQVKPDVEVAVLFLADLVHGVGYRGA